jgi:co-chaperonin GroES (HSP10)
MSLKEFTGHLLGELVMVAPESTRRPSGILLPDWQRSLMGSVLALGPDATDLKKGDIVYFGAATGMESVYCGASVRIMRESEVLCVVEAEDETA